MNDLNQSLVCLAALTRLGRDPILYSDICDTKTVLVLGSIEIINDLNVRKSGDVLSQTAVERWAPCITRLLKERIKAKFSNSHSCRLCWSKRRTGASSGDSPPLVYYFGKYLAVGS